MLYIEIKKKSSEYSYIYFFESKLEKIEPKSKMENSTFYFNKKL